MHYVLYMIEALLAVNLLVVVHEFGHMLVGKIFGVSSRRFCIGLGPRLFGVRYRGTDYCVSPVPLGGYVQLESGHTHGPKGVCMTCLSPWKKILVYLAGPAANMIFVLVLFWTALFVIGYSDSEPVVGKVDPASPASEAGILPKDRILSINGKRMISWTQAVVAFERAVGRPLKVVLSRPEVEKTAANIALEVPGNGLQGADPTGKMVRLRMGPLRAASESVEKLCELSKSLFQSFTGLVTTRVSTSELVGPVYLFHISAKAAEVSQGSLVYLLAIISACLFVFNLLPLPILDGGQIFLILLESVLRRPLAPQSMKLLMHASVVGLLLLVALATRNDIGRLLSG